MVDLSTEFICRAAKGLNDQIAVDVSVVKACFRPGRQNVAFNTDGMDVQRVCGEEIELDLPGQGAIVPESERRIVVWPVVWYPQPFSSDFSIESESGHFDLFTTYIDERRGLQWDIKIKCVGSTENNRVELKDIERGVTAFQKQLPAGIIADGADRSIARQRCPAIGSIFDILCQGNEVQGVSIADYAVGNGWHSVIESDIPDVGITTGDNVAMVDASSLKLKVSIHDQTVGKIDCITQFHANCKILQSRITSHRNFSFHIRLMGFHILQNEKIELSCGAKRVCLT